MSRFGWKDIERKAAALFGLLRHPANIGGRLDFGGGKDDHFSGQVKNTKTLSLTKITALAEEMEAEACKRNQLGVVVVKMSNRRPTPMLVIMTETEWLKISSLRLQDGQEIPLEERRKTLTPRKPGYSWS